MILAKVLMRVVSTARLSTLPPKQYLEVEPLPNFGSAKSPLIVIDTVGAGPGDTVLVLQEGSGAREALFEKPDQEILPAQSVAIGIVDSINLEC